MSRFSPGKHLARAAAALLIVCAPGAADAQIQYNGSYFMHGFNDNSNRWTIGNPIGQLGQRIALGDYAFATTTNSFDLLDSQARQLRSTYLTSGRSVLVSHSAGGLVARNAYLNADPSIASRANIAGIITVATPHQGAPIGNAANVFLSQSQFRLIDSFFDVLANKLTGGGSSLFNIVGNVIIDFAQNVILNKVKSLVREQSGVDSPAGQDLRTGSSFVQRMQAGDDAPHANVYGVIEKRNAVLKVYAGIRYQDPQPLINTKAKVKSAVKACAQLFYNFIVKTSLGRKCHQADDALGSLDNRWNDWTHGPNKSTPFDGFIPKDYSQYPGLPIDGPGNFAAIGENHGTITRGIQGVRKTGDAMEFIRMRVAAPPLAASISGASYMEAGTTGTWTANAANGSGAYTYLWRAKDVASGTWMELGSAQSQDHAGSRDFMLEVTVSSGASSVVTTMQVTVSSPGCGTQIICDP